MENKFSQVTLEVPNSLLSQLTSMCACPTLRENPNDLIIECVKYAAKNAYAITTDNWSTHQDCYEELVGNLNFELI